MNLSVPSPIRRLMRLCALVLGLAHLVHAQTFLLETSILHMPSDVAVTPDGTVAIVRASEAGPPASQPDGITA